MAPNIHVNILRCHLPDDDEGEEFLPSNSQHVKEKEELPPENTPLPLPLCLQKETGQRIWQQLQSDVVDQAHVDATDTMHVPAHVRSNIVQALSSIRVLKDPKEHRDWLGTFQGNLYEVPAEILEEVATRAPRQFTARVADFNDNLFYEMQTRRGLAHLGLQPVQDILQADEYLGSFLSTESSLPQPPHVDYTWDVLQNQGQHLQIAFFPLTQEGMFLQVWNRDDDEKQILGQLIFIPYGSLLVLPASTIHGGGFRTTPDRAIVGNLRFHLYLAHNAIKLPTHQTNKYTEPGNKAKELSRRYVDTPQMQHLLQYLFV